MIVSTDPAHSLGDALGVQLSSTPRRITRSLDAVELDAPRAFARWLKEHRRPLGEILEHGTWLDHEDVDALLELSIPGVDELMGILEIDRLAARSLSDLIVVDTAPTGHTRRLLSAPETVAAVADVLGELQQEHRLIREQLARVGGPEAADRLIAALAGQARETAARLRDPRQTAFAWVTLPEELSLAETGDGRLVEHFHLHATLGADAVGTPDPARGVEEPRRGGLVVLADVEGGRVRRAEGRRLVEKVAHDCAVRCSNRPPVYRAARFATTATSKTLERRPYGSFSAESQALVLVRPGHISDTPMPYGARL